MEGRFNCMELPEPDVRIDRSNRTQPPIMPGWGIVADAEALGSSITGQRDSGEREESHAMSNQTINRVSGYIMLGLSLFAMFLVSGATILTMSGRSSPSPDGDEGTAAHLFQFAIVLLLPAGLAFLVTADWRQPLKVVKRLVLPAVALVVAFSMLYYMEHLG
jgi:hypothetical protein